MWRYTLIALVLEVTSDEMIRMMSGEAASRIWGEAGLDPSDLKLTSASFHSQYRGERNVEPEIWR